MIVAEREKKNGDAKKLFFYLLLLQMLCKTLRMFPLQDARPHVYAFHLPTIPWAIKAFSYHPPSEFPFFLVNVLFQIGSYHSIVMHLQTKRSVFFLCKPSLEKMLQTTPSSPWRLQTDTCVVTPTNASASGCKAGYKRSHALSCCLT